MPSHVHGGPMLAPQPTPFASPEQQRRAMRAAELVTLSTRLLLVGFLVMIVGIPLAALSSAGLGAICVLLGLAVIVIAAVVGQIGRGMQGRIL